MKIGDMWKMEMKPGDRVGFWQNRKMGSYMEITANEDGSLKVRCHPGSISVEPEVSNVIVIQHRK